MEKTKSKLGDNERGILHQIKVGNYETGYGKAFVWRDELIPTSGKSLDKTINKLKKLKFIKEYSVRTKEKRGSFLVGKNGKYYIVTSKGSRLKTA